MSVMATKKKSTDRHKPSRMTRIPEKMAVQLEKMAEHKSTSLVDEVKQAVREYLERNNLWPTSPTGA